VPPNHAFFLYGSLRDSDIRDIVFADSLNNTVIVPAIAYDHATYYYPGESFPILIPKKGFKAEGLLLLEPDSEALSRMEYYEGDAYEIGRLNVELDSGDEVNAAFNRAKALDEHSVEQIWHFEEWQSKQKKEFIQLTAGFMAPYPNSPDENEADEMWSNLKNQVNRSAR